LRKRLDSRKGQGAWHSDDIAIFGALKSQLGLAWRVTGAPHGCRRG
jgi:hypothetical protein